MYLLCTDEHRKRYFKKFKGKFIVSFREIPFRGSLIVAKDGSKELL